MIEFIERFSSHFDLDKQHLNWDLLRYLDILQRSAIIGCLYLESRSRLQTGTQPALS
jgi:hypothetical protein